MKCPHCGATISGYARFCQICGKPVGSDNKATPPPIPPRQRTTAHSAAHSAAETSVAPTTRERQHSDSDTPPRRKKGCGFGSVLVTLILILGGGAAWFFTQQFRLERAAFERIRHSNSTSEIEAFLATRMYMPDEHRRTAISRINFLKSDSVDFVNATTIEACERYLTIHPEGKHVAEVQSRLNSLRRSYQPSSTVLSQQQQTDSINSTSERERSSARTDAHTTYHVIVGTYINKDNALRDLSRLNAQGYTTKIEEIDYEGSRAYRVMISPFYDYQEALRVSKEVSDEDHIVWIKTD